MFIVNVVTFFEYHPYILLLLVLLFSVVIWFFWRERTRPSYHQQREVEELVKGFEQARQTIIESEEKV
ncbi:hypothetical protein U14_03866 [Candidatus Moduliflexus flocculans]|uniref:Uncharacterized protein n=1 Tax=Candidatus Moduliflexus flocculans TaxID=1499966 RepID=A0A081BQE8_9BACT|nr:hypothetical protein U14_03866 [Candidatus Moduliflexus flocculans]